MCVNQSTREEFALIGFSSGLDTHKLDDFYPRRIVLALWRVFSARLNNNYKKRENFHATSTKAKIVHNNSRQEGLDECPICSQQNSSSRNINCNVGSSYCGRASHTSSTRKFTHDKKILRSEMDSSGDPFEVRRKSGNRNNSKFGNIGNSFSSSTMRGKSEKNANSESSAAFSKEQESVDRVMASTQSVYSSWNGRNGENPSVDSVRCKKGGFRVFLVLFYLLILVGSTMGCGPGRGAGRRRAPRKLTPLVYKQHVPNVPENTLSASGLNEGKITRDHPRFKALVPNYNSDIIFRDDEGSGADRLMTQRCKEKLNTLAISVMNQWPGVKLRVIEGWDEDNIHAQHSLHYEGRAVDITTSDKDRSKYGMLARLAVEAGFDWVYYESRAHIHCSVKSDSSQAARTGGCFSGNTTVETRLGPQKISEIQPGDEILTLDASGTPTYSEVLLFLDRNASETREFYLLNLESGRQLTVTPSHLLYSIAPESLSSQEDIHQLTRNLASNVTSQYFLEKAEITFARSIQSGYYLLTLADEDFSGDWLRKMSSEDVDAAVSNSVIGKNIGNLSRRYILDRVMSMEARVETGVYAPLTSTGNLIVDGVLASCYAVIDDQKLAHWAFAPVRFAHNFYLSVAHLWKQFSRFITFSHSHSPNSSIKHTSLHVIPSNPITHNTITEQNLQPLVVHNTNINYDQSKRLDANSHRNYLDKEQGIHWYASFLYSTTKHILPSYLLYN